MKWFVEASISHRQACLTMVDFSAKLKGKKLKRLMIVQSKPQHGLFTLAFSPDKLWKLPMNFCVKVKTARKAARPVDWRVIKEPRQMMKAFPKRPSADDMMDLHAKVKALRSNLLDQFLRDKARAFQPNRTN